MLFRSFTLVAVLGCATSAVAAGRPITPADLLSLARVSDPQISPDGTRVVYSVAVPDMIANRSARDIWVVSFSGGDARQLTKTGRDGGARWSPDGRTIAFTSSRSGGTQLYVMNADGTGEPRQLTALSGDVDNIVWSPDGRTIAFTADVFPDCKDEACNTARTEEHEKSPVKAHVAEHCSSATGPRGSTANGTTCS